MCVLPKTDNNSDLNVWTPIEILFTPYFSNSWTFSLVNSSGFASNVYSPVIVNVSLIALSNLSNWLIERAVGVPPPTYMVFKFLYFAVDISVISASKYSSTGWFCIKYLLKSQYVHILTQNGICIYALCTVILMPRFSDCLSNRLHPVGLSAVILTFNFNV